MDTDLDLLVAVIAAQSQPVREAELAKALRQMDWFPAVAVRKDRCRFTPVLDITDTPA
jgi:hypothetical protein